MTDKYALLVGTSKYDDARIARLNTPETDVTTLARLLEDPQIGGFQVKLLLDQTTSQVMIELVRFLKNRSKDDLLLVYFSGHGILDEAGRLFLAAADTDKDLLSATALSSAFLKDELDRSRSKRQLLILDCCHSGAFQKGTKGDTPALTQTTFQGYGRAVFTASDAVQYALEGDQAVEGLTLSLFTHFLAEGLETGDADGGGDGLVELDEWFDYAYRKVRDHTDQQTPRKFVDNQYGELYIARSPRPAKPTELPEKLRARLHSDWKPDRLEAVKELGRLLESADKGLGVAARLALEEAAERDDSLSIRNAAAAALGLPLQAPVPLDVSPARAPVAIKPVPQPAPPPPMQTPSKGATREFNFTPGILLRHILSLALPLLFAAVVMQFYKDSDLQDYVILLWPQWLAATLLIVMSVLFRKEKIVSATWSVLGWGFALGGIMHAVVFLLLEVWDLGWMLLSGSWSPVIFGLTLACGIALLQMFSHPLSSGISPRVLAFWVTGMTLAGGLLGGLFISFVSDFVTYSIFVVAWGLLFGLINAAALRWLVARRQNSLAIHNEASASPGLLQQAPRSAIESPSTDTTQKFKLILSPLVRHVLALTLPLLFAAVVVQFYKDSEFQEIARVVGPQWISTIVLLAMSALFKKEGIVPAAWKVLGWGFFLGGLMQFSVFQILLAWNYDWVQSGSWLLLVVIFGLTLAFSIALLQVFSRPVSSGISRRVLAFWVTGMTLAGGLLSGLLIPMVSDHIAYCIFVVIWGLFFGLINALALRWLAARRQNSLAA